MQSYIFPLRNPLPVEIGEGEGRYGGENMDGGEDEEDEDDDANSELVLVIQEEKEMFASLPERRREGGRGGITRAAIKRARSRSHATFSASRV